MTPNTLNYSLRTMVLILLTAMPAAAQTVAVNGQSPPNAATVGAAASVAISVSDGPGNTTDWIGLYPAGAANSGYLSWSYLSGTRTPPAPGLTAATFSTHAPVSPGDYEWRLFANNGWSRIATSSLVTVAASTAVLTANGVTAPAQASVGAGGSITVSLAGGPGNPSDWIGLAPAGSPDSTLVDWRYLNGTTVPPTTGLSSGTVQFLAPATPGTHELRLFAHNTYTRVATAIISVSASTAAITVDDTAPPAAVSVVAGTHVSVGITGGPAQPGDWVGLFAANAADSAYLAWRYLNGSTAMPSNGQSDAQLIFAVPVTAGSYQFRFFNANIYTRLATSTTMVVSASSAALSVNGVAAPAPVTLAAGSQTLVSVNGGPANAGDWVGLFRVGEPETTWLDWRYLNDNAQLPVTGLSASTLHFGVPTAPGTYEFLFFAESGGLLASSGHVVVPQTVAQISVNGIAPPTAVTAAPGSSLTVEITGGPANPTDWVALAAQGAPGSSYIAWQYLNGSTAAPVTGLSGGTLSFVLPPAAGTYELRLFANNGYQRITTSAVIISETDVIDTTAPTITATVSPKANAAGWHNTTVMVTFACADDVSVSTCPAPVTVSGEGAAQLVSGAAIDSAGNQTPVSVSISLDRTAPTVEIPAELPAEVASAALSFDASASDSLSGLSGATCNGLSSQATANSITCSLTLRKGRNIVVVVAMDAAGNVGSDSGMISWIPTAEATSITVSPVSAGLIVAESRTFSVKDDQNRIVSATWESSDPEVVDLVEGRATAIAPGEATLTATAGGLTATTSVVVYAGPFMTAGGSRWSNPSIGGAPELADTIVLNALETDSPSLLSIEYTSSDRLQSLVRGFTVDGTEVSTAALPIGPLELIDVPLADPYGGVVAVVRDVSTFRATSIVRASWSDGAASWRRDLPDGTDVFQLMQAGDGTIYVLEGYSESSEFHEQFPFTYTAYIDIVGMDGSTGAVRFRRRLPSFTTYQRRSGADFQDVYVLSAADGMAVSSDGFVYMTTTTGFSNDMYPVTWARDSKLMRIDPAGEVAFEQLWQGNKSSSDVGPVPYQVRVRNMLPDGAGGVSFAMAASDGTLAPPVVTEKYRSTTFSNDFVMADGVVGAYVTSIDSRAVALRMIGDQPSLVSFDMRSGTVHWEIETSEAATVSLEGGGAVLVDGSGGYRVVGPSGATESAANLGVGVGPYAFGRFHPRGVDGTLKAVPWRPLNDATAYGGGGASWAVKQYGLHAKAYNVAFQQQPVFKHLGLALVPRNQEFWISLRSGWHTEFKQNPLYGDLWVVTTGGGPDGSPPSWKLSQYFNKGNGGDFDTPADPGYWLPVDPASEDATIGGLLIKSRNFPDGLFDYDAVPNPLTDGFNSNSFMRGLLNAQGLTSPPFFTTFRFPGSQKPVPPQYFASQ